MVSKRHEPGSVQAALVRMEDHAGALAAKAALNRSAFHGKLLGVKWWVKWRWCRLHMRKDHATAWQIPFGIRIRGLVPVMILAWRYCFGLSALALCDWCAWLFGAWAALHL